MGRWGLSSKLRKVEARWRINLARFLYTLISRISNVDVIFRAQMYWYFHRCIQAVSSWVCWVEWLLFWDSHYTNLKMKRCRIAKRRITPIPLTIQNDLFIFECGNSLISFFFGKRCHFYCSIASHRKFSVVSVWVLLGFIWRFIWKIWESDDLRETL